ncbi:acyltransferase [Rhizobium sp. SGZ-381]|uniref:acyltransferase n=1 Tax=Rhizobium sp. SGZ-381 TaxID=3342800 RepID=UPI00366B4F1D
MFGPAPFSYFSLLRLRLNSCLWRMRIAKTGAGTMFYPGVVVYFPGKLTVGARTQVGNGVQIWAGGGVSIGDDVLIAAHCVITTQSHDVDAARSGLLFRKTTVSEPITIGSNVWIGAGAIILPGVTIGDNSVVAAGAVVSRSVPENTLVAGVPARALRALAAAGSAARSSAHAP